MIKAKYTDKTSDGMVRTNNEDAYYVSHVLDDSHILAIVIDGVGGYEGGEVAAAMARDTIVSFYADAVELLPSLRDAVVAANNKIYQARQENAMYCHMSCVLTASLIDLRKASIEMAHVGDTRLYQFYDGQLQKLSHDHSLVGYREELGELTEEEAMNHPNRNIVSKVVGTDFIGPDSDYVECAEFPIVPNSTLLFCSDGLYDMITSATISHTLASDCPVDDKAEQLIRLANEAGGHDNITVVLVELCDETVAPNIIAAQEAPADTDVVSPAAVSPCRVLIWFTFILLLVALIALWFFLA